MPPTLAQALEEARAARESALDAKREVLSELDRFRQAMREELKARPRKFDLTDGIATVGVAALSAGVAVAFHWAYALITIGAILVTISVFPLMKRPSK